MIGLCIAKVGKNKYAITTTDMKDKLEAKYIEPRLADLETRMQAMQQRGAAAEQQQAAMQGGALGRGFYGGQTPGSDFLG